MADRVSVLLDTEELSYLVALLSVEVINMEYDAAEVGFGPKQAEHLSGLATLRGRLLEAEAHVASDN